MTIGRVGDNAVTKFMVPDRILATHLQPPSSSSDVEATYNEVPRFA